MPTKKTHFISLNQVHLHDAFFSPIQDAVVHVMIPYQEKALFDQIPGVKKSHVIENFRIAAGESQGAFYGRVFQDSDLAKWLEAVAYSLTLEPNPELEAQADKIIDLIGRAQQPDGYLNTYFTVKEPDHKWQNLAGCHELYCAGHMIEAAVAYKFATGKNKLLSICQRLCENIESRFGPGKHTGIPGHEEIELALLRLYRCTGNRKHLEMAEYFINERGKNPEFFHDEARARGWSIAGYFDTVDPTFMQNHKPVREQDRVVGHAVRSMYLLTAMADLAAIENDGPLMAACRRLWDNLVDKQMYLTAGIGSTANVEGFTTDYDLPNDTAYAETCAAVGVCFFARQMLESDPDARYADVMERALYNGTISGMQLDATKFFYVNPLEVNPSVPSIAYGDEEITLQRIGWYNCACCPPNLARLLTSLGTYAWSSDEKTVYSHLFTGGEARFDTAGGVSIKLDSRYPMEGKLVYTVFPAEDGAPFTLAVRRPGWCRNMRVTVNGKAVSSEALAENGYWMLSRNWKEGDQVVCDLEIVPRRVYSNPLVRANEDCVALMRGPMVYAFEGVDNGADLQTLRIPRDAVIRELPYDPNLLGGVIPLEISGKRCLPQKELYTDMPPEKEDAVLRAIPYYAWANRGVTQMRVWMPE